MDRREQPRAGVPGKARIERDGEIVDLAIRDLSVDGARLVGRIQLFEDDRVNVEFELEGATFTVAADVVRMEAQNSQVAVAFRVISPEARATIQQAVERLLGGVRDTSAPTVIVMHRDAEMRGALERDLAQLGRAGKVCATLLEVTSALNDPDLRCEAIIIDNELGVEVSGALLRHVAAERSKVRRIVLFGEQLQSIEHPAANLVDAVLRRPVRIRALARALGVSLSDSSIAMLPLDSEE
jgi:hypothetical protein